MSSLVSRFHYEKKVLVLPSRVKVHARTALTQRQHGQSVIRLISRRTTYPFFEIFQLNGDRPWGYGSFTRTGHAARADRRSGRSLGRRGRQDPRPRDGLGGGPRPPLPPSWDERLVHVSAERGRGPEDDEEQVAGRWPRQEQNRRLLGPLDTEVWACAGRVFVAVGHSGELEQHVCELKDPIGRSATTALVVLLGRHVREDYEGNSKPSHQPPIVYTARFTLRCCELAGQARVV